MQVLLIWAACLFALAIADAPIKNPDATGVVKDQYIVVYSADLPPGQREKLDNDANDEAKKNPKMRGILRKYAMDTFNGYSIEIDEKGLKKLLKSPFIDFVEKDVTISTSAVVARPRALVTQNGSPWGLGRISHRNAGLPSYIYDDSAGAGTTVFVLDTGIAPHNEFGSRAVWGTSFIDGAPQTDDNGHGTHVAGSIAGTTYGVAKLAKLVAVKVLDASGSGTASGTIAAIQWAVNNATALSIKAKSVINMSYGGGLSTSVNNAVNAAVVAGLTVVAAAGNGDTRSGAGSSANLVSPASASQAITVSAISNTDVMPAWANFGTVVDLLAPGTDVLSAWIGSTSATAVLNGTSMSAAYVSGLAAYLIAKEGLPSPPIVAARISSLATANKVPNPNGCQNRIPYNGNGA